MSDSTPIFDPKAELQAMEALADALGPLDAAGRDRVLRWARECFGSATADQRAASGMGATGPQPSVTPHDAIAPPAGTFSDFADLYHAAEPKTESERALVAGYWYQFSLGQADFGSQEVNTQLKDLGFGVGNITVAFYALQGQQPALVTQVKKAGNTKQARKRYKLTTAGKRVVEAMIPAD